MKTDKLLLEASIAGNSPKDSALDRLAKILNEYQCRRQCLSLEKAQELLLKLARQQQEIQCLESLVAIERQRSNELAERWSEVRHAAKAQPDDTVFEVMKQIRISVREYDAAQKRIAVLEEIAEAAKKSWQY